MINAYASLDIMVQKKSDVKALNNVPSAGDGFYLHQKNSGGETWVTGKCSELPPNTVFAVRIGSFANLSMILDEPSLSDWNDLFDPFESIRIYNNMIKRSEQSEQKQKQDIEKVIFTTNLVDRAVGDLGMHPSDKNGLLKLDQSYPYLSLIDFTSVVGRSILVLQRIEHKWKIWRAGVIGICKPSKASHK